MVVGRGGVAPLLEFVTSSRIMEEVSFFCYLGTCFSVDGYPQEEMKVRAVAGLETLGAMKCICSGVKDVSSGHWHIRMEERKLEDVEMRCVGRVDKIFNLSQCDSKSWKHLIESHPKRFYLV